MILGVRNSFGVSAALHFLGLLFAVLASEWMSSDLPQIMEITLVSVPDSDGGQSGAGKAKADPGGEKGVSLSASKKKSSRARVVVATPDFVPVGRKPRRTEDALMGSDTGSGGGALRASRGTGPAGGAGRKVRYQEPLEYPEWASEKGIVAKVVLRFKIHPNGAVDSQIIMRRTSGWRRLDELAIKAMRNYLFERLPPNAPQVAQWGELAFNFVAE